MADGVFGQIAAEDSWHKEELHQLFFELRNRFGHTFIIVTHDEDLAQITDRTIRLVDGRVVGEECRPVKDSH